MPALVEKRPFTTDIVADFPGARLVAGSPGAAVYEAEVDDRFLLIVDDSIMVDRMIPEAEALMETLVTLITFEQAADRARYRLDLGR